jgi:hypothetical protein
VRSCSRVTRLGLTFDHYALLSQRAMIVAQLVSGEYRSALCC